MKVGLLYRIRGESMQPTLREGDCVLVRGLPSSRPLMRGDIVVAATGGKAQVKRVVGLPSERIIFADGTLYIDGEMLTEPYLRGLPPYLGLGSYEHELGSEEYFLMGDNRAHSTDSRHNGAVHKSFIEGRAVSLLWPPRRWCKL